MSEKVEKSVILRIIEKLPEGRVKNAYITALSELEKSQEQDIKDRDLWTGEVPDATYVPFTAGPVFCEKCGKKVSPSTIIIEHPICSECWVSQQGGEKTEESVEQENSEVEGQILDEEEMDMSTDLRGQKPKSEKGEYFGNNMWHWRPLWDYVCDVCELSAIDREVGHPNDDYLIDEAKAKKITEKLEQRIKDGKLELDLLERQKTLEAYPEVKLEECVLKFAKTIGKPFVPGKYCLCEANVLNFTEFCRDSGGFRIR